MALRRRSVAPTLRVCNTFAVKPTRLQDRPIDQPAATGRMANSQKKNNRFFFKNPAKPCFLLAAG
jgi:hypothetical protein